LEEEEPFSLENSRDNRDKEEQKKEPESIT
jgi:hypothetical protein